LGRCTPWDHDLATTERCVDHFREVRVRDDECRTCFVGLIYLLRSPHRTRANENALFLTPILDILEHPRRIHRELADHEPRSTEL
jgi:hypothetical protein